MQVGLHDDDFNLCSLGDCTEVDLLSARCTYCKKIFCSRHISTRAHQCSEAYDAKVAGCPVCGCVVPLEYPGQRVDEAVSFHLDRGCRNLPQSTISHGFSGKGMSNSLQGGRRLGGRRACGVVDCSNHSDIRVECDRCGHSFCLDHRNPSLHHCKGNLHNERKRVVSSTAQTMSKSPVKSESEATTIANLLRMRPKTLPTIAGRSVETNTDTVTTLIVFLIPLDLSNTGSKETRPMQVLNVPPFYMTISKNAAMGKLLDLAITEASKNHSSATKPNSNQPWHVHALRIPAPEGAVGAMYSSVPLSTQICKTALVDSISTSSILQKEEGISLSSRSCATTSPLVVISHFSSLPEEFVTNLSKRIFHGGSSDGCCTVF
ncbi:unnamed protein product [Phytomonas sp. EM1]|nr:unnamed protein product [Phytomonas sp. EM1]|eukprot:CCW64947.1 unnamed protein product [Phytomonas sp. isolate EM1]